MVSRRPKIATPYSKTNTFLQGFICWQGADNPCDWNSYLYQIFKKHEPTKKNVEQALTTFGIETVPFSDWPGFNDENYNERKELTEKIINTVKNIFKGEQNNHIDFMSNLFRKAKPEAETLVIVIKERKGEYHIISKPEEKSPSWFLSHTSILNTVSKEDPVTWKPESFFNFTESMYSINSDEEATNCAFELLLWDLAKSGVNVIETDIVENVFGGIIDQATICTEEQIELYDKTIAEKYGEPLESVLSRIEPSDKPIARIQLLYEMTEKQEILLRNIKKEMNDIKKEHLETKKELIELERFKKKQLKKQEKTKKKSKAKTGSRKKKKKRKEKERMKRKAKKNR